ncbi:MAG: hypothetical protein LBK00_00330 [Treponema sp.]|jgi:hypothetical protein|nr:hypothetical protein [Treponema sp.]
MDKLRFTDLSTSDKIAMLNLTFSLAQAGVIQISDRYKDDPDSDSNPIIDGLVEEAAHLLEQSDLMGELTP